MTRPPDNEVEPTRLHHPLRHWVQVQYPRERLAPYKIPSEIRSLKPLPAAPTGKLLKNVLKTMAAESSTPHPGDST